MGTLHSCRTAFAPGLVVAAFTLGACQQAVPVPVPAPVQDNDAPQAQALDFRYADVPGDLLFTVERGPLAVAPGSPLPPEGVPIRISRHAALAAARRGTMDIALPDGTRYPVHYERSESAPGGNWTFIGRVDTTVGELAAVITFGSDGVFGLLPTPDGTMVQLTTRAGRAFLKPDGGIVPPGIDPARHPDYLQPREPAGAARQGAMAHASASIGQVASAAAAEATIDILALYTSNLVALRGSASAVETEYVNLVAVANQAHVDSGSVARLAIADFAQVAFRADGLNEDALYAITDDALADGTNLAALRDAAAADLVTLVRPYAEGDPTCGIAWIGGGELSGYQMQAHYGFSVTAVEDCGPLVLAHEVGHNLGLMHDRDTVMQSRGGELAYGAFPFSFGYRQDGPPAFATVMAYNVGAQVWINRFSHPGSTLCEGSACGIAGESDSVRSINLTAATTARFRDPAGTVSILDAHVLERNEGYPPATMTVTVRASTPAPAGGVTFDVAVTGGTATQGVDWDFAPATSAQGEIPAGGTTTTFEIQVPPDVLVEGVESVHLRLENVQGMAVHDGEAVGFIHDDDPRATVAGRIRFPAGSGAPAPEAVQVYTTLRGVDGQDHYGAAQAQGAGFDYAVDVPKGGHVTLSVTAPSPFLHSAVRLVGVEADVDGMDLDMVHGVRFSGGLRVPGGQDPPPTPVILWNMLGDGIGYYVNFDGAWYATGYALDVYPDVPMQLEVPNPPAPYVRQLVEIPPMFGPGTWDVQLRDVPSLTIGHERIVEGTAADGVHQVVMSAELSVPAPPGGVSFKLATGGTAGGDDYLLAAANTYVIVAGGTTVDIPIVIVGDDNGERDEFLELRVTDIQGAAWNPGPGSLRIVSDEVRAGTGTCIGSTEWPSVRICE